MEIAKFIPISGNHFEDFLLLTNPDDKISRTKKAWQSLKQQIQTHTPNSQEIDLNRICIDMIKMELLIFPVVEHWKRPLTNAEWAYIDKEAIQLENQMEKMKKLSRLVRKKNPLAFPGIAPLFGKLFDINQELRGNWDKFKNSWSNYKKDWQHFQSKKKQLTKVKQQTSKSENQILQKKSNNGSEIEPPLSPPMFSRDRWHALRISSKALETELLHQCDNFRNGTKQDQKFTGEETHPGVKFLVEELRKIYLKTHGFELIDRVKLVQERNDQLMQELQPYFPEPIITAKMLAETKPTPKTRETFVKTNKKNKSAPFVFSRKIILFLILILIFLSTFLIIILEKQNLSLHKNIVKHLKFVPKNKTLTAKSSEQDEFPDFNLEDMMKEFSSDIPLQESNELLKKMVTAPPDIFENIANNILHEMGKNTVFVFSEARAVYLFWKGKLEKYISPEDLQKKFKQLNRQYKNIATLKDNIEENTQGDLNIVPEILNGKSTYALEILDENGEPLKVYMTDEGAVLKLSNGKLLDKPLTTQEFNQKISKF